MTTDNILIANQNVYQNLSLMIKKDKRYEIRFNQNNEICIFQENSSRVIFVGNLDETRLLINKYFK